MSEPNTAPAAVNLPPVQQQPGWVPPVPAQPAVPPAAPIVTPEAQTPGQAELAAALAKLAKQPTAPEPVTAPDLNTYDVQSIEDPTVRSLAGAFVLVGDGLDFNRAIGAALARGDVDLIDKAYIKEKGGARAQQLIDLGASIVNAVQQQAERVENEVYAIGGGKDNWAVATAAFNASAPEELRGIVARMLDGGNTKDIHAAAKLIVSYAQQSGVAPERGSRYQPVHAGAGASGLNKQDFQAEVRKLDPNGPSYTQQYNALVQRRTIGRNSGL